MNRFFVSRLEKVESRDAERRARENEAFTRRVFCRYTDDELIDLAGWAENTEEGRKWFASDGGARALPEPFRSTWLRHRVEEVNGEPVPVHEVRPRAPTVLELPADPDTSEWIHPKPPEWRPRA